jgi:hypothetical protein
MAFRKLPSGKIIDTDHISYISQRSHTNTTGEEHNHATLHMDNNDLIQLTADDWEALETELAITEL